MKYLIGFALAFTLSIIGMAISDTFFGGFIAGITYCFLTDLYDVYMKLKNSQ